MYARNTGSEKKCVARLFSVDVVGCLEPWRVLREAQGDSCCEAGIALLEVLEDAFDKMVRAGPQESFPLTGTGVEEGDAIPTGQRGVRDWSRETRWEKVQAGGEEKGGRYSNGNTQVMCAE